VLGVLLKYTFLHISAELKLKEKQNNFVGGWLK